MPSNLEGRVLCFGPAELDLIEPLFPGMQMHRERRQVEELAQSIAARGRQLQPGNIYITEDKPPRLVFGCRRLAAVRMVRDAKLSTDPIPFRAEVWEGTYEEAIEAALDENDNRLRKNDPIDRAYELWFLTTEGGRSRRDAADRLGLGEARTHQLLLVFDLDAEVREAMEAGRIGESYARELDGLPKRQAKRLFNRFEAGELTAAEMAAEARAVKHGAGAAPSDRDIVKYLRTLERVGLMVESIRSGELRIEALAWVERGMTAATESHVWEHFRIDREAA